MDNYKYIFLNIKSKKIFFKLIILMVFTVLIYLANRIHLKSINYDMSEFWDLFYYTINNALLYFIPIVGYYLYFIKDFIMDKNFNYIYKFRDKFNWLKLKLITILILTFVFVFIVYISLIFIEFISFKFEFYYYDSINLLDNKFLNTLLNLVISYLLQVFVLYIYSVVCILSSLILYSNRSTILVFTQLILILLPFLSINSGIDIFINISLFTFSSIINLFNKGKGILHGILFLLLIIYTLTVITFFRLKRYDISHVHDE